MGKIIPLAIFLICALLILTGRASEEPQICKSVPVYLQAGDHIVPDGHGGFLVETDNTDSTPVDILSYSVLAKR